MFNFKQEKGKCSTCAKTSLNTVSFNEIEYGICDRCLVNFIKQIAKIREDIVVKVVTEQLQQSVENGELDEYIKEEFDRYTDEELIKDYRELEDAYEELDDKYIELINERDLLEQKIAILEGRLSLFEPKEDVPLSITQEDVEDSLKKL